MATRAKTTKKPAIGNPSSDAAIKQEPVIVAEQEQNAISGLSPQGSLPKPRVAGPRKRRKRQPPKKPLLQQPLVLAGIGLAAIFIIGSIVNAQDSSSMEKSVLPPPPDEFAGSGEMDSEITGWHRPML